MKQQILTQFPWPWLPATALLIFVAVFVALIVFVNLKSSRDVFAEAEVLPLSEGDKHE